ncbi:hypothetical protein [Polyangium aurulentum]|uniref:hypothetical protein n=1 Tax=Polyangium aurulentum TaxID=2567896 RepID=UPI0010AEDC1B|nr:hypothetical protein [Polyangium aurulentum]UQA58134.1 hypothetical protein E8A73_043930 [Polyangium aurulentum]
MNIRKAFFAGVVGGAAMTLILAIAYAATAAPDLQMMLGTAVGVAPSALAWLVGLALSLGFAGLVGVIYGGVFETLGAAGATTGVLVSLFHIALGGVLIGLFGAAHPLVPELFRAPGFFMGAYGGAGVVAFVLAHIAFGAIVGKIYAKTPAQQLLGS